MARFTRIALLCVLCIAAATADATSFLADGLVHSKGSTAKLSSDYYRYADTEIACLQQLNYKNCRYTGCSDCGSGFLTDTANSFFQTDFACCPKERTHGSRDDIGVVGSSGKAGTCDWEVSFYRWPDGIEEVLTGTALKRGTAWGTCYLNSEANDCDEPLCDRMAISIQGGLYVSFAYSDTNTTEPAPSDGTCEGHVPARAGSRVGAEEPAKGGAAANSNPIEKLFDTLLDHADRHLSNDAQAPAAPKSTAKVASEYEYNGETPDPQLYPGKAIIISGPFFETSKHNGKIRAAGLFEFALAFEADDGPIGTEPVNNWPVVRARHAKLRFTHEKEGYAGNEGDHSA